tara:strand:- start:14357 stop:14698 length:342 start_codon:yes stop_codon:yes gene_type:complete
MEIKDKLSIAEDFSDAPGARYREDGDNSGQEFLEDHLLPKFNLAVEGGYKLLVDIDGVWGFPSSFVSGSFGKLSLEKGAELVLKHIEFKSDDSQTQLEDIISEIEKPETDARQ